MQLIYAIFVCRNCRKTAEKMRKFGKVAKNLSQILGIGKIGEHLRKKKEKIKKSFTLPFGGEAKTFDRMMRSTCTMSLSARRPLEDTLTSSPSSSSMAERKGRQRQGDYKRAGSELKGAELN